MLRFYSCLSACVLIAIGREPGKSVPSNTRSVQESPVDSVSSKKGQINLEKSFKDLHRQTVALERFKIVLGENVDRSFKRATEVFKELHKEYVHFLLVFCCLY